jgi:hypothetical protein
MAPTMTQLIIPTNAQIASKTVQNVLTILHHVRHAIQRGIFTTRIASPLVRLIYLLITTQTPAKTAQHTASI